MYAVRDDFGFADLLTVSEREDQDAGRPIGSSMKAAVERAVQRSVIERLDLLPAGAPPEKPEDLLNRPSLSEALAELTSKYDHIIIDGPSVLAASDSRIIAASCDATLLLLSQEASTKKIGQQCRDGLTGVGATILGVVVNSAPRLSKGGKKGGATGHKERVSPTRRAALPADSSRPALPQLPHKSRIQQN
ncbi:MAG: hypothetical protein JO353_11745 [Phycisphaerae bacterium]|nr:hypothetical protein [Phycisphaerae bacterium]